jgi:RHS repeat-associated protein
MEMLDNMPVVVAASHAVTKLPIAQANYTLQQFLKQGHPYQPKDAPLAHSEKTPALPRGIAPPKQTSQPLPSSEPAKVKAVSQTLPTASLTPTSSATTTSTASPTPLRLTGSDANGVRMEVVIPAGAIDASQATTTGGKAPQGTLSIALTQRHGHYTGMTNELGSFQIQVTDAQNQVVHGLRLRSPITLIYHYRAKELYYMDLNPSKLLLVWSDLLSSAKTSAQSSAAVIQMQDNPKASTLTATSTVLDTSSVDVGLSGADDQSPPKPRFASVQGNTGQLSYNYPLTLAPGPKGTVPSLALAYSSAATNARTSPRSPAENVGEGWALTMGSVTEEKEGGGSIWYFLNGVDNVSDRLIPDSSTVTAGTNFATEHLSYVKVQMVNAGFDSQQCFHVWDTEGNYYEFGCTPGSLQYYTSGGNRTNYRYDLNQMIPVNEGTYPMRVINVSYLHDTTETSGSDYTVNDAVIKQITYGTSTAADIGNHITTNIAGTVDFLYKGVNNNTENGIQWVTAYGDNEGGCTPPSDYKNSDGENVTDERCDDPHSKSGGLDDPLVESKFSLSTIKTYVGDDSSSSHLDYSYALTYQDTPFTNCKDPLTGTNAYCAGNHLLTSITPTVYQNGTGQALPGMSFGYSTGGDRLNKYEDTSQSVPQGGDYKVQTNWRYLTSYHDHSNGVGATIVYHTAYNNSNGTPYTDDHDNRYDTFFCVWHSTECTQSPFSPTYNKMWTQQVVYQIISTGKDSSASGLSTATTTYHYLLTKTTGSCAADTASPVDTDCVGFGWIPSTSDGWQDFYHGEFRGFGEVDIQSPAGDLTVQKFYATKGWDSSQSDSANYLAGQLYQEDVYQGGNADASKLLKRTVNSYAGTNSTATSCASGYVSGYYKPCEAVLLTSKTTMYEQTGSSNSNAPWAQHDYTYDDYNSSGWISGKYHNPTKEVISASNAPTVTKNMTYATTNTTVSGHVYYTIHNLAHSELVDASNHTWQCADTTYDEGVASGVPQPAAGWPTTQTTYSKCGDNTTAIKTYTGYDGNGNTVASVGGVQASNSSIYGGVGCTLATAPAFFPASSWSGTHYTNCTAYNANGLPTDTWNAFGQQKTTTYDATQGLLPTAVKDVGNNATTTTAYSYASGNTTTKISEPGETGYTRQGTLTSACTDSSTLPCMEVDSNTSLYSSAVTRTFYDSQGRKVETLTPGPDATHTTVTFITYNDAAHSVFTSLPFRVASRTTWLDPNSATDDTGQAPKGTASFLDALDRTIASQDALFGQSGYPGIACSSFGSNATTCTVYGLGTVSGDSSTYATTKSIDANNHVQVTYDDALGRSRYTVDDSGINGGTLTANRQTTTQYNALDKAVSVAVTDLLTKSGQTVTTVTTTAQYDDLGRVISLADPDRGTHTYGYDAEDHQTTDVSGSRTLGSSYDLLGRLGCLQDAAPTADPHGACSSGAHSFIQNTYDTDPSGVTWTGSNYAVGHLIQSIATTYFPSPDSTQGTVTENMQYDQRGRLITKRMQIAATGGSLAFPTFPLYQEALSYNSVDQPTTTQTTVGGQAGYTFTQSYDATVGNLNGLSNTTTAAQTLAALSYNETHGLLSDLLLKDSGGASLANEHLQYDGDLRPAGAATTWQSNNSTIYSDGVTYDNVGNVISRASTHATVSGASGSGGSEVQNFCYDEQNRMVWASNAATGTAASGQTCGTTAVQTALGGSYTHSYVYTHLGQLWQGPLNGGGTQQQYLYCSSGHPHQVTALSASGGTPTCSATGTTSYSATYDAWGNMSSRVTGTTTSSSLSFDALDHLVRWNGSTATAANGEWYLYDADGNRVLRRSATAATSGNPATSASTLTVYAFGLEDHLYSYPGSGSTLTNTGNTYYYMVAGHLIGKLSGVSTLTTNFLLTDLLGSVVSTISNTAGSAQLLWNQLYGPYGEKRYSAGTVDSAKGFTSQYADDLTGLDYYVARYYDPVIGRFLSADTKEDNFSGFDPYAYVLGNPETKNDPTGHGWQTWAGAAVVVAGVAFVVAALVLSAPVTVTVGLAIVGVSLLAGAVIGTARGLNDQAQHPSSDLQYNLDRIGGEIAWDTTWITGGTLIGLALGPVGGPSVGPVLAAGLGTLGAGGSSIFDNPWLPPAPPSQCPSGYSCSPKPAGCPSDLNCQKNAPSNHWNASQKSRQGPSPSVNSGGGSAGNYYTVAAGDSLWAIATRFYGSGAKWQSIYSANRGVIGGNPNMIYPGQRLKI